LINEKQNDLLAEKNMNTDIKLNSSIILCKIYIMPFLF